MSAVLWDPASTLRRVLPSLRTIGLRLFGPEGWIEVGNNRNKLGLGSVLQTITSISIIFTTYGDFVALWGMAASGLVMLALLIALRATGQPKCAPLFVASLVWFLLFGSVVLVQALHPSELARLPERIEAANHGGEGAKRALSNLRDFLRPYIKEIDTYPDDEVVNIAKYFLADFAAPDSTTYFSKRSTDTIKILLESRRNAHDFRFDAATRLLDDALSQKKETDPATGWDRAALLAERGRIAGLQLKYSDAVTFFLQAASTTNIGPAERCSYRLDAATSFFYLGVTRNDNEALMRGIKLYESILAPAINRCDFSDVTRGRITWARALIIAAFEREIYPEGIDKAIGLLRSVLGALDQEESDKDQLAETQRRLGGALIMSAFQSMDIDKVHEAIPLLRESLNLVTRAGEEEDTAMAQAALGLALSLSGIMEGNSQSLAEAVPYLRMSFHQTPIRRDNHILTKAKSLLGTILALAARDSSDFEEAITVSGAAADQLHDNGNQSDWLYAQGSLSTSLMVSGIARNDPAQIRKAVEIARSALREHEQKQLIFERVNLQNTLANALRELGMRDKSASELADAASAFNEVAKVWTRQRLPFMWALTQFYIGKSMFYAAVFDQQFGTLSAAIEVLRAAFSAIGCEKHPDICVDIEGALGSALQTRGTVITDDAALSNLEEAAAIFQRMLDGSLGSHTPEDRAELEHRRGAILSLIGERDPAANTKWDEEAVRALRRALAFYTLARTPQIWTDTNRILGYTLLRLGERTGQTSVLKEAELALRDALRGIWPTLDPGQWRDIKFYLATALMELGKQQNNKKEIEEALTFFQDAQTAAFSARTSDDSEADLERRISEGIDKCQTLLKQRRE